MTIHLAIDAPQRRASESETAVALPLRKAFFHIQAITSWLVDPDVLHVMGPDLRAAREQMEPIVQSHLYDGPYDTKLVKQRRFGKEIKKQLEVLSHPTPAILSFPREIGGLGKGDTIVHLSNLYILLMGLVVDYSVSLSVLNEVLDGSKQSVVLDVLNRARVESASFSPHEFLRFS